jgi:hypothetical protein
MKTNSQLTQYCMLKFQKKNSIKKDKKKITHVNSG